jgi:glutaredoxin
MNLDKFTKKIQDNRGLYTIFYSEWCTYSIKALDLLKNKNVSFKGYKIDKINGSLQELLNKLSITKNITGYKQSHKTRPLIFFNDGDKIIFVGGYTDLVEHFNKV